MTHDESVTRGHPEASGRPLVSIGVPTCERSALLRRALSSLLAQDYPNLEIVVSDNASTDDTAAVCADITRRHAIVHYHRVQVRIPVFQNFRNALVLSHGDYFMWASDDDLWESTFVSTLMRILAPRADLTLVAAEAQYVLPDGTRLPFFPEGKAFSAQPPESSFRRIVMIAKHGYGNLFYGLYRRKALVNTAGDTALDVCTFLNELPLFVQVADRGGTHVHDSVLFFKTTSLTTYLQAAREYRFIPMAEQLGSARPANFRSGSDLSNRRLRWGRDVAGILVYHARTMADIRRALPRIHGGPGAKIALLIAFAVRLTGHFLKLAIVWRVRP